MAGSSGMQHPWEAVLQNNIVGTYNVFEASRRSGVKQVVFASSNHAVGMYEIECMSELYRPRSGVMLDETAAIRPDSLYGVSKCFGEALGRYYSDHFGLQVYCIRIGTVRHDDNPTSEAALKGPDWLPQGGDNRRRLAATWQSKRDLVEEIAACLDAEDVRFDIFDGVSNNPYRFWDLDHAHSELGWQPQDTAPTPE
jgi:hypothetical protein